MIRPSQRLGINTKEDWSQFRRLSETATVDHNNNTTNKMLSNDNTNNNLHVDNSIHGAVFCQDGFAVPPPSSASSSVSSARVTRRPPRISRTLSVTSIGSATSGGRDVSFSSSATDHLSKTGKKCNFCFNNKEPIEVWPAVCCLME